MGIKIFKPEIYLGSTKLRADKISRMSLKTIQDRVNLEDQSSGELRAKIELIEEENNKLKNEITDMEKELEVSRYKLAEHEEKKQEVEKKIDELSQETNTMLDGQEW